MSIETDAGTPAEGSATRTRELFGGAITVELPVELMDASDLRQIPDNQEVFLSPSSDTSVVVEILALVEHGAAGTDLWEAAKFHFNSIAHDNASQSSTILTPPPPSSLPSRPLGLPPCPAPYTPPPVRLEGTQRIHKFSHDPSGGARAGHEDETPDEVWVGVVLWRCWYEPEPRPDGSAQTQGGGKKKADVVLSVNVNLSAEDGSGPAERAQAERWLDRAGETLRVDDWGLFADSD